MDLTGRLFIAADLPRDFKKELNRLHKRMLGNIGGRYTRAENRHITLAFLGKTELSLVEEIAGYLRQSAERVPQSELRLGNLGTFGREDKAVLWCGLTGAEALEELAADLRGRLKDAHIRHDHKPFRSHITLARAVQTQGVDLADYKPRHVRGFIPSFTLYESTHQNGTLTYVPLFKQPAHSTL